MKCDTYNCQFNILGYCSKSKYFTITSEARCGLYAPRERVKIRNRKAYPYNNIDDIFKDFYSGRGIKHLDNPDTKFNFGDIVTTKCGFDIGFHTGEKAIYSVKAYNPKTEFGGVELINWYKTGVNAIWEECRDTYLYFKQKYGF